MDYSLSPKVSMFQTTTIKTLVGNNAAIVVPIFQVIGTVQVTMISGTVLTTLGSNITATSWRLNDQTAQAAITLAAGTTISSAAVGASIVKVTNNGSALTLLDASAGRFWETAANHMTFQEFAIVKKLAANTNIEFLYTTTNTPTSGSIQFFITYRPISDDGAILPL